MSCPIYPELILVYEIAKVVSMIRNENLLSCPFEVLKQEIHIAIFIKVGYGQSLINKGIKPLVYTLYDCTLP